MALATTIKKKFEPVCKISENENILSNEHQLTHAHIFWQFSDLDFVWQSCQSGQQNSVKLWVSFCAYKLEEEVYCLKVIPIHPSLKWLIALPFLQDRRTMHSGLTGLKNANLSIENYIFMIIRHLEHLQNNIRCSTMIVLDC